MRGGKSIWIIAGGLFVAWLLEPAWQWYFDRFLDNAARAPGGMSGAIGRVVAVTTPIHPFLLGMSLGMIFAFAIGYWGTIKANQRRCSIWISEIWKLLWLTDVQSGGRKIHGGEYQFDPQLLEFTEIIPAFVDLRFSRVRWWPQDKFYCQLTDSNEVRITRLNSGGDTLKVVYEVWGRVFFWRTVQEWRRTDRIGEIIWKQDVLLADAKDAVPSPRLPPGIA